mmetsp:Transcript_8248/g.10418  ORF Transcript_8248/g.10418 Transcript_8248/m.10418 type:complete len:119 (-) Transcript_8248:376-732(-)|eukprot:CAMPEP_0185765896 /NCGR_PEP_ID=MMETSP1174-20130828/33150_1 /TAXON_ID=35687 /ORGANISM="Dictyocha speculum, Strain CCMP1381" /LENGTH=118 /DNA_ID=CAMNT_0028449321 /DNA_START=57 /DNA_END=413 /DNA_ORIENTATION=-
MNFKVMFLLFSTVAAFTPSVKPVHSRVVTKAVPAMSMNGNFAKIGAVAGAMIAANPMVASATEGTNEIFGIDDQRIYLALPVLVAVNLLFNTWAQGQDNEDFFDALPPPPKGSVYDIE